MPYGTSICILGHGALHVSRKERSPQSTACPCFVFHVLYGDEECVLSVPEGEVLAGEIPGRQLRNAQTFIDMRTEELMLNWKLCMEGKDVVWIDPIR